MKPTRKMSVNDTMWSMRTHFGGTWFDTTGLHRKDVGAGPGHSAYRARPLSWKSEYAATDDLASPLLHVELELRSAHTAHDDANATITNTRSDRRTIRRDRSAQVVGLGFCCLRPTLQ